MGHRLPTILGKAIDDVIETLNTLSEEEEILDLVACIERMTTLKKELQESAKLRPIEDDSEADVILWNKVIAKYFEGARIQSDVYPKAMLRFRNRQGFHERPLVIRRSVQIQAPQRVLHSQQVLG